MKIGLNKQDPFREMWRSRLIKVSTVLSVLFWLLSVALPAWRVVPEIVGKTAVPLHYNIHFGIDTVGPWWQIFVVPAVGLLFMVMNLIAARMTWRRDPMLSYTIAAATAFIELLLLVAMIFIVFLHLTYGA
jgi:hypothetical protein